MKVGLFGGAFDPIHNGHLMLAEQAVNQLKLDRIVFIPCGKSPYPNKIVIGGSFERMQMVGYASNLDQKFYWCNYEVYQTAKTYTINTIREYISQFPENEYFLIVGPDIYPENFRFWEKAEEIKKLVKVVFAGKDFWIPDIGIRSTLIRQMVKEGKSIKYLVPDEVEKYIKRRGLYK